jgi:hypothetical protein
MKRLISSISISLLLSSTVFLLSCETDSYDKGEGTYSNMVAEFAEMRSDATKRGVSFETDEGVNYILNKSYTASWMTKGDSTYRTAIYYNKVGEGIASLLSVSNILTIVPRKASSFKKQTQDPAGMESCWVSKKGKYFNVGLLLKNGRDANGKEGIHGLAIMYDGTYENADHTKTAYYRLLHDKGNTPEYYTNRRFISILLPESNRPDSVRLTVRTYEGDVSKTLKI